jgi:hypothetical protein
MGSGGGTPPIGAGISGAGGGRIIPGAATGALTANFSSTNDPLFTVIGYQGGGAGVAGTGNAPSTAGAGTGGGGWGAAGGTGYSAETADTADPPGTLVGPNGLGGAGGKAINTNGYAVTWIGGSSRAYGAIG